MHSSTLKVSGMTGRTENGPSGRLLKSNLWVKGSSVLPSGGSGGVDDVSLSHMSTRHATGCAIKVSSNHDQSGNNLKFEPSAQRGAQEAPCTGSTTWSGHCCSYTAKPSRSPPEYVVLDSTELFLPPTETLAKSDRSRRC